MGIIRQLFGTRAGAGSQQMSGVTNPSAWLIDLLGGAESTTGIKVDEFTALTSSAIWACVRALSETVGSLPLHVYRDRQDGGKDRVPDYPLYHLLHEQPNPEMSSMEWRETAMGHLLLWGNSYSEIERDQVMRPVSIWPLRPDRMRIARDEQGALQYQYQLFSGGGTAYFTADDILHVRTLGRDGILGLSPIGQMREAIGLSLAMERYGGALFGNGAQPGGILSTQGILSDKATQNLRDSWEREHRGPSNAGRVAVLEQGVTWQATGMPPEDAQFILGRQFSLTEIARIYRMPPHLIQDLTRSTNNNIEQQALEYVIHTLRPYLVRWEQAFQRSLFPGRDQKRYYALFNVDGLLRGDQASRYAAYAVGRQWGWLSADDIREREDMNPLPNGDGKEYLKPLNMVPAGTVIPLPDPNAPPPGGGDGDSAPTDQPPSARSAQLLEAFLEDVGRRLVAREDADICRAARKQLGSLKNPREFQRWLTAFYLEHRGFVFKQVLPALQALDGDLAEELALEVSGRHLDALQACLVGYEGVADLELRLASWKSERPAQLAAHESKRMLRSSWAEVDPGSTALASMGEALARLAEPRQPPSVTVNQPPINVAPAEVRFAEGAIQAPTQIAEGAVQVQAAPTPDVHVDVQAAPTPDVHIAAPPPAEVRVEVAPPVFAADSIRVDVAAPPPAQFTMEPGAVQVDVQAPPATPPADVRVDVQPPPPAQVNISEGAVQVDIQAPPAPPPADVRVEVQPPELRIEPGAVRVDVQPPPPPPPAEVRVDVQAPPPAQMTIAEGAVHVDVAAPPPTEVHVDSPDVHVDVHQPPAPPPAEVNVEVQAAPPPQVTFQEGSVRVEQPKPPPRPRLARAKAQEAEKKTQELKKRRRTPRKPQS